MDMKDKFLIEEIASVFNCNIDYEQLDFIYQSYADLGDNPSIRVINYPFVQSLIEKQNKRVEDFTELVGECLSEGYSSKYGFFVFNDGKCYVLELGLREFDSREELEEFYKE